MILWTTSVTNAKYSHNQLNYRILCANGGVSVMLDLVNVYVHTNFGQILSIRSNDI